MYSDSTDYAIMMYNFFCVFGTFWIVTVFAKVSSIPKRIAYA